MEGRRRPFTQHFATNKGKEGDVDDPMDRFRKSLENSWNVKSMGIIPSDAESAANATAVALESVVDKNIFFVNILVPQYDISSGGKYYDEILAVEFCIALSKRLSETSMICVRDSTVLNPVQRVLDAREKDSNDNSQTKSSCSSSTVPSEDPFDDVTNNFNDPSNDEMILVESADVSDFRARLMADWSSKKDAATNEPADKIEASLEPRKPYRLVSLLGDARSFSTNSPTVMNEIVHAVSENALPKKHERFIILLAPSSKEEMIGIRALVQKYSARKFILVNCKLDPLPPELYNAETVYSVLPMVGQQTKGGDDDLEAPKVVVLRRFPRDWELYVDIGNGFDLAASCGLDGLTGGSFVTGPPKQWIQSHLEMYLRKMR